MSLQTAPYYHITTQGELTAKQSHNVAPRPAADVLYGSYPTIKMAFSPCLRWLTESSSPREE